MSDQFPSEDPRLFLDLYSSGIKSQIVRISLLLDVFTPLAGGEADVRTVANATGCDPYALRFLLNYLHSMGLLERKGGFYSLTPQAAMFFVRGAKTFVGDWVLANTNPQLFDGIRRAIKGERPFFPPFPYDQYAILESYLPDHFEEARQMWRTVGIEAGSPPHMTVLDLSCGCAIRSFVLAEGDPTLHVTCVDDIKVLTVARTLAARMKILSQVTFLPGDFRTIPLQEAYYQVALIGRITYSLTEPQNIALFRRVRDSLVEGGKFVVDAQMSSSEPNESSTFQNLLLWSVSGGGIHSLDSYDQWLSVAGFREVKILKDNWLLATR